MMRFFLNDMRSQQGIMALYLITSKPAQRYFFSLDPIIAALPDCLRQVTLLYSTKKITFWYLCTTLVPFALYVFLKVAAQTNQRPTISVTSGDSSSAPLLPTFQLYDDQSDLSFNLKSQSMLLIIIAIICITYGGYLLRYNILSFKILRQLKGLQGYQKSMKFVLKIRY